MPFLILLPLLIPSEKKSKGSEKSKGSGVFSRRTVHLFLPE